MAGPRPRPPPLAAAFAVSALLLPPVGATACWGVNPAGACAHSETATANAAPTADEITTVLPIRFLTSKPSLKTRTLVLKALYQNSGGGAAQRLTSGRSKYAVN